MQSCAIWSLGSTFKGTKPGGTELVDIDFAKIQADFSGVIKNRAEHLTKYQNIPNLHLC